MTAYIRLQTKALEGIYRFGKEQRELTGSFIGRVFQATMMMYVRSQMLAMRT